MYASAWHRLWRFDSSSGTMLRIEPVCVQLWARACVQREQATVRLLHDSSRFTGRWHAAWRSADWPCSDGGRRRARSLVGTGASPRPGDAETDPVALVDAERRPGLDFSIADTLDQSAAWLEDAGYSVERVIPASIEEAALLGRCWC